MTRDPSPSKLSSAVSREEAIVNNFLENEVGEEVLLSMLKSGEITEPMFESFIDKNHDNFPYGSFPYTNFPYSTKHWASVAYEDCYQRCLPLISMGLDLYNDVAQRIRPAVLMGFIKAFGHQWRENAIGDPAQSLFAKITNLAPQHVYYSVGEALRNNLVNLPGSKTDPIAFEILLRARDLDGNWTTAFAKAMESARREVEEALENGEYQAAHAIRSCLKNYSENIVRIKDILNAKVAAPKDVPDETLSSCAEILRHEDVLYKKNVHKHLSKYFGILYKSAGDLLNTVENLDPKKLHQAVGPLGLNLRTVMPRGAKSNHGLSA